MSYEKTASALNGAYGKGANAHTWMGQSFGQITAGAIAADPSDLLDAMVADGILKRDRLISKNTVYFVPKPHVHEWTVTYVGRSCEWVDLKCACGKGASAPNRLPIEVPGV
jgi:hypothetical protein